MDQNSFNICEKEIFKLLKNSIDKSKLSFVLNLGHRVFFNDGRSFGICTNKIWKQEKKSLKYQSLFRDFYSNELLMMKRNNYKISFRVQGQLHNEFIRATNHHGLGNVLVILRFNKNYISAYYFLADGGNYNATNDFINNIKTFEDIVDVNKKNIDQLVEINSMYNFSHELLPQYAISELFDFEKTEDTFVNQLKIEKNIFTVKQNEVLSLLASGITSYKAIATHMGNGEKAVEWHINELKKKMNLLKKAELINFAKKIMV